MKKPDLDRIEELAKAATPGPWKRILSQSYCSPEEVDAGYCRHPGSVTVDCSTGKEKDKRCGGTDNWNWAFVQGPTFYENVHKWSPHSRSMRRQDADFIAALKPAFVQGWIEYTRELELSKEIVLNDLNSANELIPRLELQVADLKEQCDTLTAKLEIAERALVNVQYFTRPSNKAYGKYEEVTFQCVAANRAAHKALQKLQGDGK